MGSTIRTIRYDGKQFSYRFTPEMKADIDRIKANPLSPIFFENDSQIVRALINFARYIFEKKKAGKKLTKQEADTYRRLYPIVETVFKKEGFDLSDYAPPPTP